MKSLRLTESVNIAELLDETARSLDFDLMATDRVWQRWAVSVGSGLPVERWDETPRSRLTPLDDGTAIVVDRIYCTSPQRTQKILASWYAGTSGPGVLARKLGIRDEAGMFMEWRVVLRWSRERFIESKHRDLIRMVEARL